MKIIKNVYIERFRSIHRQNIETNSINIFSGKNNAGKSNILRALNLFFNTKSGFDQKYNHDKDYNIAYTRRATGARTIHIRVDFFGRGTGALRDDFSISRSFKIDSEPGGFEYLSSNPDVQEEIKKGNGNITRQFTLFLNKIKYIYVPAVRDKDFLSSMLLDFEQLLNDKKGKQFNQKINDLSQILEEKSEKISEDFQKFIKLPTKVSLSTSIQDILGAARVYVDSGIRTQIASGGRTNKELIDLFSSGDGILMSYIPHFLIHVFKSLSKKNFILGFEEPENSLEYSKVQALAKKFDDDFKSKSQIFITTHSPAFIKLKEKEDVQFYRVYINPEDLTQASQISTISDIERKQQRLLDRDGVLNSEYLLLSEELGFIEQSQEIESFLKNLKQEKENWEEEKKDAKEKLELEFSEENYPQKVFLCEDDSGNTKIFWKNAFRKKGIEDVKVLSTGGCTKFHQEDIFLDKRKEDENYNPKIFRQIDRDGLTDEQIVAYERFIFEKYDSKLDYRFSILPVNEIENFWVILDEESFDNNFWITNIDNIQDNFDRTAKSNCTSLYNRTKKNNLFLDISNEKVQSMRNLAKNNKNMFFPGKEICKKIHNLNPISSISEKEIEEYPEELNDYLDSIKNFFDN